MIGIVVIPPASQSAVSAADAKAVAAQATADSAMTKAGEAMAGALDGSDRQQAVRIQITPDADGRYVFVYPKEYVAGTKPAVTTTAETPKGAAYRNDASVEEGLATNKQVVIIVQRIPKTLTATVLGAVLTVFAPVTTPVWVNILVRAPI